MMARPLTRHGSRGWSVRAAPWRGAQPLAGGRGRRTSGIEFPMFTVDPGGATAPSLFRRDPCGVGGRFLRAGFPGCALRSGANGRHPSGMIRARCTPEGCSGITNPRHPCEMIRGRCVAREGTPKGCSAISRRSRQAHLRELSSQCLRLTPQGSRRRRTWAATPAGSEVDFCARDSPDALCDPGLMADIPAGSEVDFCARDSPDALCDPGLMADIPPG